MVVVVGLLLAFEVEVVWAIEFAQGVGYLYLTENSMVASVDLDLKMYRILHKIFRWLLCHNLDRT